MSFRSTVDRHLVHRAAVAEVFVTDVQETPGPTYVAAAQLPMAHAYYSDDLLTPKRFDILLVAEASRQAAMYACHRFLDVPLGTAFAVRTLEVQLADGDGLRVGHAPGELWIVMTFPEVRRRGTEVRHFRVHQELEMAGHRLGTVAMEVSAMSAADYRGLRYLQRQSDPPTTVDLRAGRAPGRTVQPGLVGRRDPANVVLAELDPGAPGEHGPTAELRPAFGNRGMFDHDYDHHPGMVLMEGARQFALLVAGGPATALGLRARFLRYAELDAPVRLSMPRQVYRAEPGNRLAVPVQVHQDTAAVAELVCFLRTGEST
ncbi:ScbA/BarX family gamma-butyrolactone biosynthesis protein [Dactylosporangium sucinum]|uniref:Adhesin n=1 Tax=Dactylosporangium sucinum TaxID=1424081 RepID=A0A917X6N6_9ACTN|nr:ScbA/BarX family gamma-butyrolactone biosynthesis protein [Dactylosporangium sucinum]GGM87489.1 adhesin [Dactylosporangium sucinum]